MAVLTWILRDWEKNTFPLGEESPYHESHRHVSTATLVARQAAKEAVGYTNGCPLNMQGTPQARRWIGEKRACVPASTCSLHLTDASSLFLHIQPSLSLKRPLNFNGKQKKELLFHPQLLPLKEKASEKKKKSLISECFPLFHSPCP